MTRQQTSKELTKSPDKGAQLLRMSKKLRKAISILATSGKKQTEVAKETGMTDSTLSRNLARPEIRNYLEHQKALFATDLDKLKLHGQAIAIRTGIELMENSSSDAVRARTVEFFAGEKRAPVVAVQVNTAPPTGYEYRRKTDAPDIRSEASDAEVVDMSADSRKPE